MEPTGDHRGPDAPDRSSAPADTPLIRVLDELAAEGFDTELLVRPDPPGTLRCRRCDREFPAGELAVARERRLEGASDPADLQIVFAGTCPRCGTGCVVTLSYGPNASHVDADVLTALELPDDHDAREVIALASTDTSSAATASRVEPHETSALVPADFPLAQALALAVGLGFVVLAIAGFSATGVSGFTDSDNTHEVLVFRINPLHNLVHLVIGVAGLVAGWRLEWAQRFGIAFAVLYGSLLVFGLVAGGSDWDPFAVRAAESWLHASGLAIGVLIAALGSWELRAYHARERHPRRHSARQTSRS